MLAAFAGIGLVFIAVVALAIVTMLWVMGMVPPSERGAAHGLFASGPAYEPANDPSRSGRP
ncbi:MAG TPA: hypothetical protein VFI59_11875 [Actinomycetota bacterium]|nr:hypothetical protein [Actinomycetota bacterium]